MSSHALQPVQLQRRDHRHLVREMLDSHYICARMPLLSRASSACYVSVTL